MTTAMRSASLVLAGVLFSMAGRSTPLEGAGKPKPQAATAQFRCQGAAPGTCPTPSAPDRIQADLGGAYLAAEFNPSTNEGASLNVNGEFFLNLAVTNPDTTMPGRSLLLDFGSGPLGTFSMQTGYMRTNTLAADDVNLLAGGLLGIPCGGHTQALLLVTFPDPSNPSREWVVRFNPFDYPTSNKVLVTRNPGTSWTITNLPDGADHAVLVSRTTVRNKLTIVNEGTYAMPFSVDVSAADAPACP